LGNLGGSFGSTVTSINNSGSVLGNSYLPGNVFSHPFQWTQSGGMQDLSATLGDSTGVGAINDAGEIVGSETLPSRYVLAYLWTPSTGVQTLGYLSGGYESAAMALNANGAVVGWGLTAKGQEHGFLWTLEGGMQDLNTLVFPKGNGITINLGWSVNAAGQILAAYGGALSNMVLSPKMTVTITSSQNPSSFGQPVTFTATVNSIAGPPPDGETIVFHNNGNGILGSASLLHGVASLRTSTLSARTHGITASYLGDANYVAAAPATVSQVVNQASTDTTLVSSLNPSTFGQSVTFTATVASQFGGTETGSVTFMDGSTVLQTVNLSRNAAKYTTKTLAVRGVSPDA
jgi:probable HAF family extracellular repeat protein